MERTRTIAGSPVRSSTATWTAVTELIVATLDVSPHLDGESIRAECDRIAGAMSAVIAANGLQGDGLTLVADPVHLHLLVATGNDAFSAEADERLDAVPGGTTATDWTLYVVPPALLEATVNEAAAGASHVKLGPPPAPQSSKAQSAGFKIDLDAFRGADLR